MPLITRETTSNNFNTTASGLGQLTGTTSLDLTTSPSAATTPASPFSTNRSAGLGSVVASVPTYGTTIVNFASTTSATSFTTAPAATPTANRPVIIAVYSIVSSGTPNTPTLTGCNLTWTQLTTAQLGVRRITTFIASGASPNSTSFVADFSAQSQQRIIVWGYEIINCRTSTSAAAGAVGATASATSISAGSNSNSFVNPRYMAFYGRASGSSTSRTYDGTTITNFNSSATAPVYEVGDAIAATNNATLAWSTSANTVVASSALGFTGVSGSYLTSGGSLYTMKSGALELSYPMTYTTGLTANNTDVMTNRIDLFVLGDTSSSTVLTTTSGYTLQCYYSYSKGPDGSSGTADDYNTINIVIYDNTNATTLVSTSITESTGRSQSQIWNLKFEIIPITATTVQLKASWNIPPVSSGSNLTGSIATGTITPANPNGSLGVKYLNLTASTTQYMDSLSVNDYAIVTKQSVTQGINRTAVW